MVGKKQTHRSDDFDEDAAKEFYSANKFVPPGPSELVNFVDQLKFGQCFNCFKSLS